MATEVRRPLWKRPAAIAGAVIPLIVAVLVAVLASLSETPRLDASSEATLRASLERITAKMSDARKKEFYADCMDLTFPDTMKSAFQLTFLTDRPPWASGRKMFKPLDGMSAAEIHQRAEKARREFRETENNAALSPPEQPLPGVPSPFGASPDAESPAPK